MTSNRRTAEPLLRVPTLGLLALYGVIPVTLLIVAVDLTRLDQWLLHQWLPSYPAHWAFWTLVFNMPHITASLLIMADRDYLQVYRRPFFWPLLIIVAAILFVPMLFGDTLFLIILALYTMYHVLSQQFGISLMLLRRRPDRLFESWRWLSTLGGTLMYLSIYSGMIRADATLLGLPLRAMVEVAVITMVAATLPLVMLLSKRSPNRLASWYLWGNFAMLVTGCGYWLLGYTVFVILGPRIIHDLTAFTIYAVHDQNRNASQRHNLVYRLLAFTRLPPALLCPLVAMGVAWLVFDVGMGIRLDLFGHDVQPALFLLYLCTFMHYYMEGRVWKRSSLHRRSVAFA